MQWSDAIKPPSERMLRQFAVLWILLFGALAGWRAWTGEGSVSTILLAFVAVSVGATGIWRPRLVRWIYSGWMMLAFPIGWTITQVVLIVLYFGVFTPIALVFRLIGRDALALSRHKQPSYWTTKPASSSTADYLREY